MPLLELLYLAPDTELTLVESASLNPPEPCFLVIEILEALALFDFEALRTSLSFDDVQILLLFILAFL